MNEAGLMAGRVIPCAPRCSGTGPRLSVRPAAHAREHCQRTHKERAVFVLLSLLSTRYDRSGTTQSRSGFFTGRGLFRTLVSCLFLLLPVVAWAHVGSPNVFFEGMAGLYPVHVIIRPPEVIPGLADISVRVEGRGIEQVTALPIKWNAGRKGAPPPDVATLVRGETNLYTAQLWFMESGSQSVELEIKGGSGTGRVLIPVDAVAMRVLNMDKALATVLGLLGVGLAILLLSVIGAAVRESVLAPGEKPAGKWGARIAVGTSATLLILAIWGGKNWWDAEASDYRNNRLYQPMSAQAIVRLEKGQRILRLEITDPRFERASPLMPDHGKLMHLFLVQEPKLETFAHLHPVKLDRKTFEVRLPDLPAGQYQASFQHSGIRSLEFT